MLKNMFPLSIPCGVPTTRHTFVDHNLWHIVLQFYSNVIDFKNLF